MFSEKTLLHVILTVIVLAGIGIAPKASRNEVFTEEPTAFSRPAAQELPTVGSFKKFRKLITKAIESESGRWPNQVRGARLMFDTVSQGDAVTSNKVLSGKPNVSDQNKGMILSGAPNTLEAGADYSTTNIQVQGVDEADIVKTDGEFIYQISGRQLVVTRATPAASMRVVATLGFDDDSDFGPRELHVDDERLVVVGGSYRQHNEDKNQSQHIPTVKALIYSLEDGRPKLTREVEIEGDYVSSRRIGSALYLVANKWINVDLPHEGVSPEAQERQNRIEFKRHSRPPVYRDSASSKRLMQPGFDEVSYFPGSTQTNYLSVAGIDIDRPDTEMQVATYLGAGEHIYASTQNLYVTMTRPEKEDTQTLSPDTSEDTTGAEPDAPDDFILVDMIAPGVRMETAIYKFALDNGRTVYRGEGAVPGTVLNQFSMDEHEDNFRIATTLDDWGPEGREFEGPKNNIYVLDDALKIVGRLEGLAPGERIYSARFMGPRAYLVTFKQVDPLFVIDLSDPSAPAVLGELKIPGYSDYLHPLDENHLIGFGMETGMKVAVFDVTDVTKPVEKWKTVIGDSGTDSPLLSDHRALLIDIERGLVAFPVSVYRPGKFEFQGLYVYRLRENKTLTLRGRITHLPKETDDPYTRYETRQINRSLYIGEMLYTVSDGAIKANDLDNLAEIGEILVGPAAR